MDKITDDRINKLINRSILIYYIITMLLLCALGVMSIVILLHTGWSIAYIVTGILIHIFWLFTTIRSNYENEIHFVPFYYIFINIYAFPVALVLWQVQVHSVMLFYILLPLLILFRFNNLTSTIYAVAGSVSAIVAAIIISNTTNFWQIEISQSFILYLDIIVIFAAMAYIVDFAYYYHKIFAVKNETQPLIGEQKKKEQETEIIKQEELYNTILGFFEKKQPYRQQNYRLAMLAADLNTSSRYLSEAINTCYGGTFESLLNKYRLEFVKKMLDEGLAEKYTMEHICTSAGYSSRSSFYENFRKVFDMSPHDYLEIQKSQALSI